MISLADGIHAGFLLFLVLVLVWLVPAVDGCLSALRRLAVALQDLVEIESERSRPQPESEAMRRHKARWAERAAANGRPDVGGPYVG